MSLREAAAPDGRAKLLLSVQTRSVETAQAIWPDADEQDVGDLRMYFDWRNEEEVAVARAAFERAQALGIAFFRLDDLEGEQITDFDQALAVARGQETGGEVEASPAQAAQAEQSVPEPPRARGGRRGARIQGIPPVRGGRG